MRWWKSKPNKWSAIHAGMELLFQGSRGNDAMMLVNSPCLISKRWLRLDFEFCCFFQKKKKSTCILLEKLGSHYASPTLISRAQIPYPILRVQFADNILPFLPLKTFVLSRSGTSHSRLQLLLSLSLSLLNGLGPWVFSFINILSFSGKPCFFRPSVPFKVHSAQTENWKKEVPEDATPDIQGRAPKKWEQMGEWSARAQ